MFGGIPYICTTTVNGKSRNMIVFTPDELEVVSRNKKAVAKLGSREPVLRPRERPQKLKNLGTQGINEPLTF